MGCSSIAGEIDILEGVNGVPPNQATLHTSSGAFLLGDSSHSGSLLVLTSFTPAND